MTEHARARLVGRRNPPIAELVCLSACLLPRLGETVLDAVRSTRERLLANHLVQPFDEFRVQGDCDGPLMPCHVTLYMMETY